MKELKRKFFKWAYDYCHKHYQEFYELPTTYPDIPEVEQMSNEEKGKHTMYWTKTSGHYALLVFKTLKLKSHIEGMLIDKVTGDKFILSFRKMGTATYQPPYKECQTLQE